MNNDSRYNAELKEAEKHYKSKSYSSALIIFERLLTSENLYLSSGHNDPDFATHAYNMRFLKMRIDDCRKQISTQFTSGFTGRKPKAQNSKPGKAISCTKAFFCGIIIAVLLASCFAFIANYNPEWASLTFGEDIAGSFRWIPAIGKTITTYLEAHNIDLLSIIDQTITLPVEASYCLIAFMSMLIALLIVRWLVLGVINFITHHHEKLEPDPIIQPT